MSFNKLHRLFDELQDAVNDCQTDVNKFVEGNNSAGTRVRKAMMNVKNLAQEVRIEVQDQKNAQFYNNKGSYMLPFFILLYILFYLDVYTLLNICFYFLVVIRS